MRATQSELKEIRRDFARSGGFARARALSAKRREEIARKAAQARWHPKEKRNG